MSDTIYIIGFDVCLIGAGIYIGYLENRIKDLKHKIDLLEQEKQIYKRSETNITPRINGID